MTFLCRKRLSRGGFFRGSARLAGCFRNGRHRWGRGNGANRGRRGGPTGGTWRRGRIKRRSGSEEAWDLRWRPSAKYEVQSTKERRRCESEFCERFAAVVGADAAPGVDVDVVGNE